jgi:hypothetical protein
MGTGEVGCPNDDAFHCKEIRNPHICPADDCIKGGCLLEISLCCLLQYIAAVPCVGAFVSLHA